MIIFMSKVVRIIQLSEPSAVEDPIVFEDAAEASIMATDLVNDEAAESTTPGENFCSEDEILRITDDPLNHPNAPDDDQVELKPHIPHIKFVDVNDANKFSVVIFVDMATKNEERLLQQVKSLDSNSFEIIVDRKVKLHAYLFSIFNFSEKFKKKFKNVFLFLVFIKIKM